ncbi:hybrid sensor histidine kinase/response regulator [Oryzifoliimicrobium ureilyticus]|uniref:hybrid sensor histidine kinase/response regulator n=1 Tax=Oryzifoliimicrobium ureilyticus TaxID=3113724 RepID=UPI00307662CB
MSAHAASLQEGSLEGRYRLLVDAITDYAIYMLDVSGHVSTWNEGAQRIKGYQEYEILGEHFSRFYTEEDKAAKLPAKAMKTAEAQGRFESEGWRVRKDGRRFWAHVILEAIRNSDGQLIGFAKITRDLTERKTAAELLKRSEDQFRILVQGVTDYAIYMLDLQGHVSSWNAGAHRIKGYEPDEIVGEHFSRFYTEEDRRDGLPQKALETARLEGRFEREGWRVRKDGSRFWANVIIDAIKSDDGHVIGFAKITRDITEKRQAQEALERAQQELFQSQKMEAVGQLTGGVAHDFNNLLMAILGSLEIARKRALEGQNVVGLIDNAIQGAKRGASLTQRLLAFSRKQDLKLEPVALPALVSGMAELLQTSIGPSIDMKITFPLTLPPVWSDPNQLESALLNLVVNARDAMRDGGTISIEGRKRALNRGEIPDLCAGDYVCLSVTDEGEGMDVQTLENAATPFFTTKGVGKGTGLGLSMVQGLMAQSGGRLVLKSALGEGTSAELWLPVSNQELRSGQADEAFPYIKQETSADHASNASLRVLAVDDDALVLMNTVLMLEDLGHSVVQAQSAAEALQLLETTPRPDVVITDHSMPRMTGAELATIIGNRFPEVKVILASGFLEIPGGMDASVARLGKPFSQQQLSDFLSLIAPDYGK